MDNQAARDTYFLLKRFSMPSGNTTIDAVSVKHRDGEYLISLYTLMIKLIITQAWILVVLFGVAVFMKKTHSHNRAVATVGVWNAQASPLSVATLVVRYVWYTRGELWYLLMWVVLAALTVCASTSASIVLPGLLDIGTVAPVNPDSVFIPPVGLKGSANALAYALQVPSALRAVVAGGTIGKSTTDNGKITNRRVEKRSDPVITKTALTDDSLHPGVQMNYRYRVTGSDFGLQHRPNLLLDISGSCITDYTWWDGKRSNATKDSAGIVTAVTDFYILWHDPDPKNVTRVSSLDNGPPFALFPILPHAFNNPGVGNSSYAIIPSSVWRPSFTAGTDPWYLTIPTKPNYNTPYDYIVDAARPVLSCWENAVWTYNGQAANVNNLDSLKDLNLSSAFSNAFVSFLLRPKITSLGALLGRASLASSATSAVGAAIDAQTSSVYDDFVRLVNGAYIATINILADTTTYPNPSDPRVTNAAIDPNTGLNDRAYGDCVVSSPDIMTLSVRALIVVPILLVALLVIIFGIGQLPAPWRLSQALHATVIYSHLAKDADWKRQTIATYTGQKGEAAIIPRYDEKGELIWVPSETRGPVTTVEDVEAPKVTAVVTVVDRDEKSGEVS